MSSYALSPVNMLAPPAVLCKSTFVSTVGVSILFFSW